MYDVEKSFFYVALSWYQQACFEKAVDRVEMIATKSI